MNRQEQLAPWLQFPRRLILWLIAFALASALILSLREPLLGLGSAGVLELDWSESLASQRPVTELIGERLPNSLWLLGGALLLAAFLTLLLTPVGISLHQLGEKSGPPGFVLQGIGRLVLFGVTTAPVFVLGVLLLFLFALQLQLVPLSGMRDLTDLEGTGPQLSHLVLPALTLALLPAVLAAQATARKLSLPWVQRGGRLWLADLLAGLGFLAGQMGGLLSGLVLVENIFAWPGLGRLLLQAVIQRDLPVVLGVVNVLIGLTLAGQLTAEAGYWLARLLLKDEVTQAESLSPRPGRARRIWLVLALALLLVPVGLAVGGLLIDPETALTIDLQSRNAPPSAEHPWGVDELGRDIRARLLRGSLTTLVSTTLGALFLFIPAALIGGLTGYLAARRTLWTESLADLILLPVKVILLIPALPGAMVLSLLFGPVGIGTISLIASLMLLPRLIRLAGTLWPAVPHPAARWKLGLIGAGVILGGALFATFHLVVALDFLGLGIAPPAPGLGSSFSLNTLRTNPGGLLTAGAIMGAIALVLYTTTEAMISFFREKEGLVSLNQ